MNHVLISGGQLMRFPEVYTGARVDGHSRVRRAPGQVRADAFGAAQPKRQGENRLMRWARGMQTENKVK